MSEWKVEQALRQGFLGLGFDASIIATPNREFKAPGDGRLWYEITNLPASRDPLTLGDGGEDEYIGVFQIDISVEQGSGLKAAMEAASVLAAFFIAGRVVEHDGQKVKIKRAITSPHHLSGVRDVVTVSVYWSARFVRNLS